MNEKVKQKWIEALVSGAYTQGQGKLRTADNKFCCLGVLCDLYLDENPDTEWEKEVAGNYIFLEETEYLPLEVQQWAGMDTREGIYDKVDQDEFVDQRALTDDNDTGATFPIIAALIRDHF